MSPESSLGTGGGDVVATGDNGEFVRISACSLSSGAKPT